MCERARDRGLRHFVELPGDEPSAWARNMDRIVGTLQRAMAEQVKRSRIFAKATRLMPAVAIEQVCKKVEALEPVSSRQRRTTLVREVSVRDIEKAVLSEAPGEKVGSADPGSADLDRNAG